MTKSLIDYPAFASEQVEYRDGGNYNKYEHGGRGVGYRPNPCVWGFGPYERYLTIDVDLTFMGPNRVIVEREICNVETFEEGTMDEYYVYSVVRRKTTLLLSGDELGAAWPEIEMQKMSGARVSISQPPTILRNPWEVSVYCGI